MSKHINPLAKHNLYGRKIVGADHAVHLLRRTALAESIATPDTKPVLHGDNRSTLKATTTQYSHQRPVARVLCVDC